MNNKIIEYLNKEKGYNIPTAYYKNIEYWNAWWQGYDDSFHKYFEVSNEVKVARELYSLKMGKKICEDWASLLLNEQTEIVTEDERANELLGYVLNGFWHNANALVERTFATGTGAIVIKLNKMLLSGEKIVKSGDTRITFDYITAQNIIPLTFENGIITEVAFVSEIMDKGKKYLYLETHELEKGKYKITNTYFSHGDGEEIQKVDLPESVAQEIYTNTDIPFFAIITPNIVVNTKEKSNGLGMSVFANAIDNLKGVDLAFNNFCRDFKLGGKKIFYSDSLIKYDENGRAIAPDDVMQQLFTVVGDMPITENGQNALMQEYNPVLRVSENKDGLQSQLDYLSFKCGLGTKHYQFNNGQIVTATQYTGDKQELIQNASKHMITIEYALKQLVKAVLWIGNEVLGLPIDCETEITVNFEDGFIIDKESERLRDIEEMREGIMQKWEYRAKWYGEDEETAKKMTEQATDDEIMGF